MDCGQVSPVDEISLSRRELLLLMTILPPCAWAGYLGDYDLEGRYGFGERNSRPEGNFGNYDFSEYAEFGQNITVDPADTPYNSYLSISEQQATSTPQYHLLDYDSNNPLDPYGLTDRAFLEKITEITGFLIEITEGVARPVESLKYYVLYQNVRLRAVLRFAKTTGGASSVRTLRVLANLKVAGNVVGKAVLALTVAEFTIRTLDALARNGEVNVVDVAQEMYSTEIEYASKAMNAVSETYNSFIDDHVAPHYRYLEQSVEARLRLGYL
jgi:hypothetical protein